MNEPGKSFRRRAVKPLPDLRKASLKVGTESPEAEARFLGVCRRQDEAARLMAIMGKLEPPAAIDGQKLSKAEVDAYALAVNHARGTAPQADQFLKLADTMAKRASARFFTICAAAMRAVKDERSNQYTQTDAHRMAALQAKLELETSLGCLPTQAQVKARAFDLVRLFIKRRGQDFEPLEPDAKRWSKILQSVALDYLPRKTRGPGAK